LERGKRVAFYPDYSDLPFSSDYTAIAFSVII